MRSPDEALDCAAVEERLEPFVDGELAAEEAAAVEAHLALCPGCARERELALAVREGLRNLPRWDAPGRVLEAVRRAAGGTRRTAGPAPVRVPWAMRTAAAAALVIAAAASVLWWHGSTTLEPARPTPAEVARASAEVRYALGLVARATRTAAVESGRRTLVEHLLRPVADVLGTSGGGSKSATASASVDGTAVQGGSS